MNITTADRTPDGVEFQHFQADFFKSRSLSVSTVNSADVAHEYSSNPSPTSVSRRSSEEKVFNGLASPLLNFPNPFGKLTKKLKKSVPAPIVTSSRKSASESGSSIISIATGNTSPLTSPSTKLKLLSPGIPAAPQFQPPRAQSMPDIADEYFQKHQQKPSIRPPKSNSISASVATDFESLYSLEERNSHVSHPDHLSFHSIASIDALRATNLEQSSLMGASSALTTQHENPGWSVKDGVLVAAEDSHDPLEHNGNDDAETENDPESHQGPVEDLVENLVATDVLERLNLQ